MKELTALIILITIVSCQPQNTISENEAKVLLETWNQAYYDKDTSVINKVLHPDYIYSGADGSQATKKDVIAELANSDYRIIKTNFYDLETRTYENTAIIRGWEAMRILSDSGDTSNVELRFIDVYIKQNGTVQAIATQTFPKK